MVEEAEKAKYGGEAPLPQLWKELSPNGDILVTMALQYPPNIEYATYGHFDSMLHARISTRDDRVREFIDQDPARGDPVAQTAATWDLYDAEVKRPGTAES